MQLLAVILVWIGVIVLLCMGSGLLAFIGFFAVIFAGFWATAQLLGGGPTITITDRSTTPSSPGRPEF